MPLISIIIPVFNAERYLAQCVESVLKVKDGNIEIILVNDGSTDRSLEICDSFSANNDAIKVVNQRNQGVSVARNEGLKRARGEYLYFIDSDDICLLESWKIISTGADLYIGEYKIGTPVSNKHLRSDIQEHDYLPTAYLNEDLKLCVGAFVVKKELVVGRNIVFPLDIKYGEDQEFILKSIVNAQIIEILRTPMCLYRTNLNSAMYKITTRRFDVVLSRIRMLEYFKSYASELYDELKFRFIPESIITVSEGLFRHGMKFREVRNYFDLTPDLIAYRQSIISDKAGYKASIARRMFSPAFNHISLKILQLRILRDNSIYSMRCKLSRLKSRLRF